MRGSPLDRRRVQRYDIVAGKDNYLLATAFCSATDLDPDSGALTTASHCFD